MLRSTEPDRGNHKRPERGGPFPTRTDPPHLTLVASSTRTRARRRLRWVVGVSALLIAPGGYLHLCLYRRGYRTIPTIGTAFLLTVIASGVLALGLLVLRGFPNRLARLGGIALSAGTLVAFAISRTPGGLFNFHEVGFQPSPQAALAVISEASAFLLLSATFVMERATLTRRRPSRA